MVHQGQRNCRERNNNSMNGSAVMQSNLSGCAFIVAANAIAIQLLPSSCFSIDLTLFFPFFFFFFSIHFRPTSSTDRTVFYDFDTQTSVIIIFFFFFLASPNNREPRYGIVHRILRVCMCFFFSFFKRKFRREFARGVDKLLNRCLKKITRFIFFDVLR